MDLLEIARKTITAFAHLSDEEQEAWDALSDSERFKLEREARARAHQKLESQVRRDVHQHGERARKHYSALSAGAQEFLGLDRLLRAPVATAKPRPRGAGRPKVRGAARRSSARSGDSGDDGQPSEPEPHPEPPARRLCAFCGKDIPADRSPRALYCTDRHADRDRARRKRRRDRERDVRPPTPQPADYWRMREITDEDRERLRRLAVCGCNGRHIEFDPGECFRCGHPLPYSGVA